jgi:pyruvate/2-oxoglutarate dehydrogenase complex dihydrolipoamide dehydrogenase (E3) component
MSTAIEVLPKDLHNEKLIANVHPRDWKNPKAKDRYHLVVIGAGTAGLVTAAGSAGLGAKVALIERHLMGGDCLNVGCVPSKGVISAARSWHRARRSHDDFAGPQVNGGENFAAAMERMRRLRAGISHVDGAPRFSQELGIDVFLGQGRFLGPDRVEIDGQTLNFRRAVIATGARAAAPKIPGLEKIRYLTNETIFELTELPRRLLVLGSGPIGCEMAQAFQRFGSEVSVFERGNEIMPREDQDAAAIVRKSMERDGVQFLCRTKLLGIEPIGSAVRVEYEQDGQRRTIEGDQLLVAIGRAPNIEGLGLEAAQVDYDERGVQVDPYLRTSNKRIYAVGDIASPYKFTHTADAQARIVIQNALFDGIPLGLAMKKQNLIVPWATYTAPEIAHVGMYEKDAKAAGIEIDTITVQLEHVDRAVLEGEAEGFLRVHVKRGSDQIVGATLVAEHAGEMISELTLAMKAGVGLGALAAVIHPYPTQAEVIRKAGDAYNRTKLTARTKSILQTMLRIFS